MPSSRIPGSVCTSKPRWVVDLGTSCLQQSPQPGPLLQGSVKSRVGDWSEKEKLLEAARRATPHLPAEMQEQFAALFKPPMLTFMGIALAAWAASHYFGVGQIFDALMLIVGAALLGWQMITAAEALGDYFLTARDAQTDEELDAAARHLAKAVTIIGIAAFTALLMKKAGGKSKSAAALAAEEKALVNTLLKRIMGSTENVGALPLKNVEVAVKFFRSAKRPLSQDDMVQQLRGIDLHKPVQIVEIEAGTVLVQNVSRGDILTKGKDAAAGQWFTRSGVSVDKIGIAQGNRERVLYEATERIQVLKSKAAGINDTKTPGRTSNVNAPNRSSGAANTPGEAAGSSSKSEALARRRDYSKPDPMAGTGPKTIAAEMAGGGGEQYLILRDASGRLPVKEVP